MRQTSAALETERERYFKFYNLSPAGFVTLDNRGLIAEINLTLANLLGTAPGGLVGQPFSSLICRDDRTVYARFRQQPLETGKPESCELRLVRPDGKRLWMQLATLAETDENGTPICHIVLTDISERKRAEEALRQSNELLSLFMKHSPIHAYIKEVTATESRVLLASDNFETMVGIPGSAMQGKTMAELFPAEFAAKMTRDDRAVITEGNVLKVDEDFDGRHYTTIKFPILLEGRSLLAGFTVDITERKQLEAALQRAHDELEQRVHERTAELNRSNLALQNSQEQFRAIAAQTPDHFFIQDLDLRYRLVINPQLGLKPADMIGKTDRDLVGKADAKRLTAIKMKVLATGKPFHLELSLPNRKGEIETLDGVYIPKRSLKGMVDGLIGYFHNVTERQRAKEALHKSEERYRVLFTSSRDALLTLEPPAWKFTSINPVGLEMFRAPDSEGFLKMGPEELSPRFQPDGRTSQEAAKAIIKAALREGSHHFEWRHRRLNGEEFPASVLLTRVDLAGRILLQATVRDITERVRLEQEVLAISERERQRIGNDLHDGLGQMLAGAGYMTNSLRMDLAKSSAPEAGQLRRIEEVIREAIAQTRSMAMDVHPVGPETNGLMAALEKLAKKTSEQFCIRCDFHCRHPVLFKDNQDATHLFRIAQEAVTNAIKHGSPKRIVITLTQTPVRLNLAIKDDGIGLPPQPPKKPGMGLSIMRYRAGIIGGSLTVQRGTAGGTIVECRVRLTSSSQREPKAAGHRPKK